MSVMHLTTKFDANVFNETRRPWHSAAMLELGPSRWVSVNLFHSGWR